jgi:CheY-like chemotaxis protein
MSRRSFETNFVPGQPLRVLIVEDSPADAELASRALQGHGYDVRVDVVSTANAFAAKLSQEIYDVILCDYNLAGWSGLEALNLLERLQQDVPFILVTGRLDDSTAAVFIDNGVDDYVLKDRLGRLPLAVRRVLREQRLLEERKKSAAERERLIQKLEETLAEVKRLNGLLPICITCKRVLSVKGYWSRIEVFIERNSDARVSPSLCPTCAASRSPEYYS